MLVHRALRGRLPHEVLALQPRTDDEGVLWRIYTQALADGWQPPHCRCSTAEMKPEAAKRQEQLTGRIAREISAAGLDGLVEQVQRERPKNERLVHHGGQRPPTREQEITMCCRLAGVADLAAGFIADASMTLDRVRDRISRARAEVDEQLVINTKHGVERSTAQQARESLDRAVADLNDAQGSAR